ncbi:hypothetical protein TNCV_3163501 [Trichonephila clavipes]|nr:hypothetical protein TNCV_3163501 [Trichonephila clavipes]
MCGVHHLPRAAQSDIEEETTWSLCGWFLRQSCQVARLHMTTTAGSDVDQSGRPIFDDFGQHLWLYMGNNTANTVFQKVKRLWLIRIDQ